MVEILHIIKYNVHTFLLKKPVAPNLDVTEFLKQLWILKILIMTFDLIKIVNKT